MKLRPNLSRVDLSFVVAFVSRYSLPLRTVSSGVHIYVTEESVSVTKLSLVSTKTVYQYECAWFALFVDKLSRHSDYTALLEYLCLLSDRLKHFAIHSA